MAQKILKTRSGIASTLSRLSKIDSPGTPAYTKVFGMPSPTNEGTISKLIDGHNEFVDFKEMMLKRPF